MNGLQKRQSRSINQRHRQEHSRRCKKTVVIVNCKEKPMETHSRSQQKQWQPKLEASQSCRLWQGVSGTGWYIFRFAIGVRSVWSDEDVRKATGSENREREHDTTSLVGPHVLRTG